MKTKNLILKSLLFLVVVLVSQGLEARKRRVLFVGNSYVTTNNLPAMIAAVANSQGDTLIYDLNAPGGTTLSGHFSSAATRAKIALGGWDLVVIQAQSQEPAFSDNQVAAQTLPFAYKLDSLINKIDSCTETQFYMTWGRKNGDASNCAFYPPICTYAGMQDKLSERYLKMAQMAKGSVAPVGEAWRKMVTAHPSIELYVPDQSHPAVTGTYLAALVFYQTLFQKPLSGTIYRPAGIADSTIAFIQGTSKATVQDSLKKWYQHGRMAKAGFEFQVQANVVTFQNTSYAAKNFIWNFGDGETSTLAQPQHIYSQPGTYSVLLKVTNGCKSDTLRKTIQVLPTEIHSSQWNDVEAFPVPFDQELKIQIRNGLRMVKVEIRDVLGRLVFEESLPDNHLAIGYLSKGTYSLKIELQNGGIEHRKIFKQ